MSWKCCFALVCLLVVIPKIGLAENRAVTVVNYSIGGGWAEKSDDVKSYEGDADVNLPLAKYLGAHMSISAARYDNTSTTDSYRVNAALFLRDYDFGLIGLRVSHVEVDPEVVERVDYQTYSAVVRKYIRVFTVDLTASHSERTKWLSSSDYGSISLAAYPIENMKIGISAGFLDAKENYSLSVVYQPECLESRIALGAGLSLDEDNDTTFNVSLRYHFGKPNVLINRDRQERF